MRSLVWAIALLVWALCLGKVLLFVGILLFCIRPKREEDDDSEDWDEIAGELE